MTRSVELLKAILASPWLGYLLVTLLLLHQCRSDREAKAKLESDRARTTETQQLEAAGFEVIDRVEESELAAKVGALESELQGLREQAEELRRRAKVRPIAAASVTSPPTVIEFVSGDRLQLKMGEIIYRTEAGNHVLAGSLEAWRIGSGPPTLLLSQPFTETLVTAMELPTRTPKAPGWGVGPALVMNKDGLGFGAAIASPLVRIPVIGITAETILMGTGNSNAWSLGVAEVMRF